MFVQTWLAGGSHSGIVAYLFSQWVKGSCSPTRYLSLENASADICLFGVELFRFQTESTSALLVVSLLLRGIVSVRVGMLAEAHLCGRVCEFPWNPGGFGRSQPPRSSCTTPWRAAASGDISASPKLRIGSPACWQSGQSLPD